MKQYSLSDLQTFAAVVESGSFHQAAHRLDTSAATVSRRIAALETTLGVRLLNRTTRQVQINDGGRQFYDDVRNILDALQEAEEKVSTDSAAISGSLRLAAPLSFGIKVIAPLLPAFLKQHSDLHIDLHLEDQPTDLYAKGIDLALRIGALNDSSLVATKLCDIAFGYYAAPAYLQQHGEPALPDDLAEHHCLHYNLTGYSREWGLQGSSNHQPVSLSANNGEALCEAAIQGLGIVALPRFIVEPALAQGQLKPVLSNYPPEPSPLYALRLSRPFTPQKVRLLISYFQFHLGRMS